MGVPHLNILTKCDKIQDKEVLEVITSSNSTAEILQDLGHTKPMQFFNARFQKLNDAIVGVIDSFSLVAYQPLDITDEESIMDVIMQIDNMVQYDEYRMPSDKKFLDG